MEHLKNKILDHLSSNGIDVEHLVFKGDARLPYGRFAEIAFKVPNEYIDRWDYFMARVNDYSPELSSVQCAYKQGIFKIIFNSHEDADISAYKKVLTDFLYLLERKYYLVCPPQYEISVLVKPTHRCNLDCRYCYDKPYRDEIKNDMDLAVLDKFLYLLSNYASKVNLIWHGGEPTLVGREWYEKAYEEVISKYPMIDFTFSMMTNGVLLDKEWMKLFEKYDIDPGMSFNTGCQTYLRCSSQLNENTKREFDISKKIEKTLKENKVSVIETITKANYQDMIKIYEHYKNLGCQLSMNHIFHTAEAEKNSLELSAREYAKEYLKYFTHWLYDSNGIDERSASDMLLNVIGAQKTTCENSDCRYRWLAVNPLGDLYPCDRYFPEEYKIGSVFEFESIDEVFNSKPYGNYVLGIQNRLNEKCGKCGYVGTCRGGCNATSLESEGTLEKADKFSCMLYKLKYDGVYEILRTIDVVGDLSLNPIARQIMLENSFYSVKEIMDFMKDVGANFQELEYNPKKLMECSEYQVFRGINYLKDGSSKFERFTDFVYSFEESQIDENKRMRQAELYFYLKEIANDALTSKDKLDQTM